MNHLTFQIEYIKTSLLEMIELVKSQFEKSSEALLNHDLELAEEIIRREARVNALELNLYKECEQNIALYQPVASELRLLISTIKSVSELERIGDHAVFVAKSLVDFQHKPFSKQYIESFFIC
ncbi:MAG: PhoU domain-containing protein [Flavobacteriaceae bacterium]|nr:PhoU domain-containing protein [Flavobacteriaceae bacterium]